MTRQGVDDQLVAPLRNAEKRAAQRVVAWRTASARTSCATEIRRVMAAITRIERVGDAERFALTQRVEPFGIVSARSAPGRCLGQPR